MHVAKRSENNRDTGVYWIRAPTPHAYFKPRSKSRTPGDNGPLDEMDIHIYIYKYVKFVTSQLWYNGVGTPHLKKRISFFVNKSILHVKSL